MIYKPEHTVDLDTGAILNAEVRPGNEADQKDLSLHVLQAQANLNAAMVAPADQLTIESATADKGYFAVTEMKALQAEGIRTVISDPVPNRKMEKLSAADAAAVRSARRSSRSESGKELLRRRGMHLERSFAHLLDAGGARRTTLRGLENLNKRFKISAAIYNLSQLMRKLFGVGTAKQWAAMGKALFLLLRAFLGFGRAPMHRTTASRGELSSTYKHGLRAIITCHVKIAITGDFPKIWRIQENCSFSTGC